MMDIDHKSASHSRKSVERQGLILLFFLLLVGIYFIYQFGFPAGWTFDDWLSLHGLSEVVDFDSAKTYVFGNSTGPTGRPIAMLSFLLNIDDWDQHADGFRQVNTVIHLFNAILIAVAGWQVAKIVPALKEDAISFGVMLALVWVAHPFFASAVLSAVQRMVVLSAGFVLLGINGYLYGRNRVFTHRSQGLAIMLLTLGAGVLLATFSKENGALLVVFVGLLEVQILSRYRPVMLPYWRAFSMAMLWGPVLLFSVYVAVSWQAIELAQNNAYRAFSWSQRLWSEFLILWEYVRQIFVPNIMAMGPLQDDSTRIHGMDYASLAALSAWIVVVGVAWRLKQRFPVILFGIGFFLAGHMIESSFIQLELYFEHRNYVPAIGLLVIPVTVLFSGTGRRAKALVWVIVLPLLFLLYLTTSSWGDPLLSAQRWHDYHPTSFRAIQKRMDIMQITEGDVSAADFIADVSDNMPDRLNIAALALKLQCEIGNKARGTSLLSRIERLVKQPNPLRGELGFVGFLTATISQRINKNCVWIEYARLESILLPLLENPAIQAHPADLSRLYVTLSRMDFATGDIVNGLKHIHQGYLLHKSYKLLGIYNRLLRDLGRQEEADALKAAFLSELPGEISSIEEHKRRVEAAIDAVNK